MIDGASRLPPEARGIVTAVRRSAAAVLALVCAFTLEPACAADHVLVMTISDYPRNALEGVRHDAQSALRMARKLGYDTAGATVLKDSQLTGTGLRAALAGLLSRVQRNDRVFIYYSGHGYSVTQQNHCVQGLVAQDETLIPTAELSAQLDGIKTLVSDALVIFDACFSGGNRDMSVTRGGAGAVSEEPEAFRAKVWTPRGGERCELPVNELAKAWEPPDAAEATRALVFPKSNFTFIAAATEREVALDDRERGGLATTGLMQCVDEGVASAGGPVTAQDLAACAQAHVDRQVQRINARLKGRQFLPHQVTVYGNADKILPVVTVDRPGAPAPRPSATGGATADRVLAAFRRFAASSNGNWGLRVEPSAERAALGQSVRLRFQTNQPGYVQLLYVGSDRREIRRIWPAEGQVRRVEVSEGELPISLRLSPPAGENTVLMVLSSQPLDLDPILRGGAAPASTGTLQQLSCELMRQRNLVVKEDGPAPTACASAPGGPGMSVGAGGVDGYTARIVTLEGLP
jgi:hypothetical protein